MPSAYSPCLDILHTDLVTNRQTDTIDLTRGGGGVVLTDKHTGCMLTDRRTIFTSRISNLPDSGGVVLTEKHTGCILTDRQTYNFYL